MDIVVLHNDSVLGERIIKTWRDKYSHTNELQLVHDCSLDDLEKRTPRLVLLASDMPSDFEHLVLKQCRDLNQSVLSVLGRGQTVLVGPLETPGTPGCVTCLELRFENTFDRSLLSLFNQPDAEPLDMSEADLMAISNIVIEEIQRIIQESKASPNVIGSVAVYDEGGQYEWVPLVPSHDCPRCNLVPNDDPTLAEVRFTSHLVRDIEALRVGMVDFKRLEELFMHTKVGYVSSSHEIWNGGRYVQADASISTPAGDDIVGYGSGQSSVDARQSAMLEVLERSCGFQAVNRRPTVVGKYVDLAEIAVNPSWFGLHNYDLLESLNHRLEPFNEEKNYSWVWAYSTKRKQPVLIPEQIAYYGPTADEKRFVTETSSGCALGGTVEEAVLHGVFEVLERDGFLNMWYGKLAVPELKLSSHCPPKTSEAFTYLVENGFKVRLFNLSHDLSIPVICAVAVNKRKGYPSVVSGSACHLNPYQAVHGALREVTVQVVNLLRAPKEKRKQAMSMFLDSSQIREILDHVAVAALPDAASRWKFLLQQANRGQIQSVEDVYPDIHERYQISSRDIGLILGSVLDDLHERGFDVIVLNQTSAEVSYGELHAVKVLIPGMTPITFGYGFQRVRGLSRLFELPYQMGYSERVLTEEDLNPDCHPFS